MFFRKRNRRRVDLAKKTGELKAVAKHHAPWALRVLASLTISGLLAYGGVEGWKWATTSPRFALSDVGFTGTSRATDAELIRLGNIQLGTNVVAMDVGGIERALATHPWVKQVRATRHLPSRLTIEIVEHQPVAMISLGELYLVNDDGEPFKRVQAGEALDLPLVTGLERDALVSRRDESLAKLKDALSVADAYGKSAASKGSPLSEVHVNDEGVTLVTSQGQEIRIGEGAVAEKLARLARVKRELSQRSLAAEVIRLDNRARPAWVTVQLTTGSPEKANRPVK